MLQTDYNQFDYYSYSSAFSSEKIIGEHSKNITQKHTLAVDSLIEEINKFITEAEFFIKTNALNISVESYINLITEFKIGADTLDEISTGIAQAKEKYSSITHIYTQREWSIQSCKSRLSLLTWTANRYLNLLNIK